jgi:hypothetical protein
MLWSLFVGSRCRSEWCWANEEFQAGSFTRQKKGIEYELEFEDEYDSGTIARLEGLFFARSRFVGINRLVEFW